MAAGQLGGVLYPAHDLPDSIRAQAINLHFGTAMQAWNEHRYREAVALFRDHVAVYPDSPWAAEAVLHIGCDAQYHGRYREAEESFARIINTYQGNPHPGAVRLVSKARVRLANQKTLQGNFAAASQQLALVKRSSPDWRDRTYAAHWIRRLAGWRAGEQALLNCGAQALAQVLQQAGKESAAKEVRTLLAPSGQGHSLQDLKDLALRYGYRLQGLKLTVAQLKEIPLPAIVQLSPRQDGDRGHYWVLERYRQETLTLFDPQSGRRFQQNPAEFSGEWGGRAMVLARGQALPGAPLAELEMQRTHGGCCGEPRPESDLGIPSWGGGKKGRGGSGCGAPVWDVNMVNMNFFVSDTPLWYRPAIGPGVGITLSYNSQSAISQHEPFGNKWQFNYGSYLVEDSGGQVTIFMPDGRRDVYPPDGAGGYTRPYQVFNTLTKIGDNHFELRSPKDTVFVYKLPPGTTSQQPFLVEIRNVYGQKLRMGYDSKVRLTTITDAQGLITTLTYNDNDLVTMVKDPFSRTATFIYDSQRNLRKITDMGGYWTSFTYDADVYLTTLTDARGTWRFATEPADGIPNGIPGYPDGNPYPAPGATMYENYRITATNPLGKKSEYYFCGDNAWGWYVNFREYKPYVSLEDSNYNVPRRIHHFNHYGPLRGEISSIYYPEGYPSNGLSHSFGYDSAGNCTQIYDGSAFYDFTYNDQGNITSKSLPIYYDKIYLAYAANGVDLVEVKDPLGTVILTRDAFHNVTSVTDRLGNKTSFKFNTYGQVISHTDALATVTTYTYNAAHRLQKVTRAGKTLASYTYDSLGRVDTFTGPTGLTLGFQRDNLNRVTRIDYPDGKWIGYNYASCCPDLVESVTDRAGRTSSYVYDKLGRLTQITNAEGGIFKFFYDANGNLISLMDAKGKITLFTYDLDNRPVRKTYPDGSNLEYTYDTAGRVKKVRNARGDNVNYTYDSLNRLTSFSADDSNTLYGHYSYDKSNRLVSMDNNYWLPIYNFTYDANSQLLSVNGPWANDTITYQYDALGRRVILTPEQGQPVTYGYDVLNRLTTIQLGSDLPFIYNYSGASPLPLKLTRPDGSFTSYTYDNLKRLASVTNRKASGTLIRKYAYTYNDQDQRGSETISGATHGRYADKSTAYTYNKLNQLISSDYPYRRFRYDLDGNLIQGYTPAGRLFTASYDPQNRLKTMEFTDQNGNVNTTIYYYAGNVLIQVKKYKNADLVSDSRYIYDGFLTLQERDSDNLVINEYAWGLGNSGGVGGLLHLNHWGAHYSYIYDGKANVTALLDSNYAVAAAYKYDPFGRLMARTGTLTQPYQFSTKPYDAQTGLSFYGYRFYSPVLGRWLNRDPVGEKGGFNLYGFVGNNPANRIDPYGLDESSGYAGFGVTGNVIGPGGGTVAVMTDSAGNAYVKVGAGVMTPGVDVNVIYGGGSPSEGMAIELSGGFLGNGGSVAYKPFEEGSGWNKTDLEAATGSIESVTREIVREGVGHGLRPGVCLMATYTWKIPAPLPPLPEVASSDMPGDPKEPSSRLTRAILAGTDPFRPKVSSPVPTMPAEFSAGEFPGPPAPDPNAPPVGPNPNGPGE
jgi:RHS repeat-associated protein